MTKPRAMPNIKPLALIVVGVIGCAMWVGVVGLALFVIGYVR